MEFAERCRAERQAINTVTQGSAADLMKLAMLRIQRHLRYVSSVPDASTETLLSLLASPLR